MSYEMKDIPFDFKAVDKGVREGALGKATQEHDKSLDMLREYFMTKRGERAQAVAQKRAEADSVRRTPPRLFPAEPPVWIPLPGIMLLPMVSGSRNFGQTMLAMDAVLRCAATVRLWSMRIWCFSSGMALPMAPDMCWNSAVPCPNPTISSPLVIRRTERICNRFSPQRSS